MIENSFQDCFLKLKVTDRVEALVQNVLEGESKLETLRDSYKTSLRSHWKKIIDVLYETTDDKTALLHAHLQSLEEQVNTLQAINDIDKLEVAWIALNETYEDFKADESKVSELAQQLQILRKNRSHIVLDTSLKLDEYCQRIMVQAEEHRAYKASFNDDLASEVRAVKHSFTELLKNLFQKQRVEKLRLMIDNFELAHKERCNSQVEAYQETIRKRKLLMMRVFQAEQELRSCQFKLRKVPYVHFQSISDASKTISNSNSQLISMQNSYSQLEDSTKSNMEASKHQKVVLDKQLAQILRETTKVQIELCDVIKQAIRQNIYRHDDLCCLTPESFDACVR